MTANTPFELLREIDTLLTQTHIPYWLRGGWAIDFMLGKITRPHSDIDLVAWEQDTAALQACLLNAGFALSRDLGVQVDFVKAGQEISVVFVALNDDGQLLTPDLPTWIWRPDALTHPPATLDGLTCQVVAPAQLLQEKLEYEHATGRPLRDKDKQSITILRDMLTHPA